MPTCLRLFWHLIRDAASRTFWTAGRSKPIKMAIMAITTSNSISVKPSRRRSAFVHFFITAHLPAPPEGGLEDRRQNQNNVPPQWSLRTHERLGLSRTAESSVGHRFLKRVLAGKAGY